MANSLGLRLKQVHTGVSLVSMRMIGVLLLAVFLGIIGLWQTGLLARITTSGEALTVQNIALPAPDTISVDIRNSGAEPLTVAQIQVDAAYWVFAIEPGTLIKPAQQATITIPYLWVYDEPHTITIVTGSGATFEGQIQAPRPGVGR